MTGTIVPFTANKLVARLSRTKVTDLEEHILDSYFWAMMKNYECLSLKPYLCWSLRQYLTKTLLSTLHARHSLTFSGAKQVSPMLSTFVIFKLCSFWPYDNIKMAVMFIIICFRADAFRKTEILLSLAFFGLSPKPEAGGNFVNIIWLLPGQ